MNRSRIGLTALVLFMGVTAASAHSLWIESGDGGYKVFFGEPDQGGREKKDKFERFTKMKAWKADGSEAPLVLREDHLFAKAERGGITAANLESPVRDSSRQGPGPVKPYQYLRFVDGLDKPSAPTSELFLDIVPAGGGALAFTVLKNGQPLADASVEVIAPNGWRHPFRADEKGRVQIEAPWPGTYWIKTELRDATPGEFGGKKYEAALHAATVTFVKQ